MSLDIKIYAPKTDSYYQLSTSKCGTNDKVWLFNQDGEGGDFDADEVANVIYNALDKYFNENH